MITISIEKLILSMVLTLILFGIIIMYIIDDLNKKHNNEIDKIREENAKESIKQRDIYNELKNREVEQYKRFYEMQYKRQPEYSRVTFKLYGKGNETLTIDYIKGNCELRNDGFWKIKDKDGNIILLNQKFIKEVRVYEAGNTRGSSEDDKV